MPVAAVGWPGAVALPVACAWPVPASPLPVSTALPGVETGTVGGTSGTVTSAAAVVVPAGAVALGALVDSGAALTAAVGSAPTWTVAGAVSAALAPFRGAGSATTVCARRSVTAEAVAVTAGSGEPVPATRSRWAARAAACAIGLGFKATTDGVTRATCVVTAIGAPRTFVVVGRLVACTGATVGPAGFESGAVCHASVPTPATTAAVAPRPAAPPGRRLVTGSANERSPGRSQPSSPNSERRGGSAEQVSQLRRCAIAARRCESGSSEPSSRGRSRVATAHDMPSSSWRRRLPRARMRSPVTVVSPMPRAAAISSRERPSIASSSSAVRCLAGSPCSAERISSACTADASGIGVATASWSETRRGRCCARR